MNLKGKKIITFSYDDGNTQDKRLVELFNKYGMKCTFNVNSGLHPENSVWSFKGSDVRRMSLSELKTLYEGHEVAVHTSTHPDLTKLSYEEMLKEVQEDKDRLSQTFGTDIIGMAYPYGTYNEEVFKALRESDISYSRTVNATKDFLPPENWLAWHPTCHHNDLLADPTILDRFVNSDLTSPMLYIWGHSYEFDGDNNWDEFEELLKKLKAIENACFVTNKTAFNFFK